MKHLLGADVAVAESVVGRLHAVNQWLSAASRPGWEVLDVGCGYGWIEEHAFRSDLGLSFVGIEPTDDDLAIFRSRITEPGATTMVASGLELPFNDDRFDLYIATEVLEHIPKGTEPLLFSEAFRVLKPGGTALITTPARRLRSELTDPARWLTGHRHYSLRKIQELAESAGFQISNLEVRGGYAELVMLYDLYFSKWVLRRPPMLTARIRSALNSEWAQDFDGFMGIWLEVQKPLAIRLPESVLPRETVFPTRIGRTQ